MKIFLCPGSAENQKFKRWPTSNFNILSSFFLNNNWEVGIILGPDESYLEKYFNGHEIIKSPSFKKLANIAHNSNLIICNDSFLLHFFSFFNINVLGLYGPTDPNRTLPLNASKIISSRFSETRPCWGLPNYGNCDDGRCSCLDGLEPKHVYEKALAIINRDNNNF